MMRAAIYARISSDREGAGLGVQAQEQDCREQADNLGWTVVAVYTDNDTSAYSGKPRPGYRSMLAAIEQGQVNAVLAWHTDRLHRSVIELEEYASVCDANNVATHTVKAGHIDLSTPSGRLVARQLGAVARYEVEHMVERQKRAKIRSAQSGTWLGGRRPFGYEPDGVTVNELEARAIRSAAAAVLAGASLRGIAKEWNAQGIATATGRQWDMTGVRRVLLRPRNAGLMEHKGQIVGLAQWPRILPEEQWYALRSFLTDPVRTITTGNARRWLGSGLYHCGACGQTVIGSTAKGKRAYRCRRGCVSRTLTGVDEYVSKVVMARLRREDLKHLLSTAMPSTDQHDLEELTVTLRRRLDELARLFSQGQIDAQQLSEGTRSINTTLSQVRDQISEAYANTALEGVADAPDPGEAWSRMPIDRKQAVVDLLCEVTILKGAEGRPHGWRPGQTYFRPDLVRITPRS